MTAAARTGAAADRSRMVDPRTAVDPAAAAGAAGLRVRVRWHDGTPATGVTVRCEPVREADAVAAGGLWLRTARTGADGVAAVGDLVPGRVRVTGDRGGEVEVDVAPGTVGDAELVLPRGLDVQGVVLDPEGLPFAGADVLLSVAPMSDDCEVVARSAADGTFALRSVALHRMLTAVADGLSCAHIDWVDAERVQTQRVLRLRRAPGVLRGVVLDANGVPVANARVIVGATGEDNGRTVGEISGADVWPARFLRTDRDGAFVAKGLAPFEWPVWVAAPGHAVWFGRADLTRDTEAQLVVRLPRGARVRGRVLDAAGAPIGGATVRAKIATGRLDPRVALVRSVQPPSWIRATTATGATGEYELAFVTPGTVKLVVFDPSGPVWARKTLAVADGETAVWDPQPPVRRTVDSLLTDPDGGPLAGWHISFLRDGALRASAQAGADGRFRCEGLDDGSYSLVVIDQDCQRTTEHDVGEVTAAAMPQHLVVPWSRVPSSRLAGTVLLADGSPAGGAFVHAVHRDFGGAVQVQTDDAGAFRTGLVPPGYYRVSAWDEAFGRSMLGAIEVARGATADLGTVRVGAPGAFTFEVVDDAGRPRADVWVRLLRLPDLEPNGHFAMEGGTQGGAKQPGRYALATENEATAAAQEFAIEAGRTTAVRLVVPGGVPVRLRVPDASTWRDRNTAVWRRDDGGVLRVEDLNELLYSAAGHSVPRMLPEGRCTLEVRAADGRVASRTVDVRAADPPQEIELPLPPAPATSAR